jgi:hypothetical protein
MLPETANNLRKGRLRQGPLVARSDAFGAYRKLPFAVVNQAPAGFTATK